MLCCCNETWIDLARIVTVSEMKKSRMANRGPHFRVGVTGAESELYFEARTPSAVDQQAIITEREGMIANWRRFKNTRANQPESIYRLGGLHINLSAICALTDIERYEISQGGNGANANRAPGYEVYLLSLRQPIRRLVAADVVATLPALETERLDLLEAWAKLHATPKRAA